MNDLWRAKFGEAYPAPRSSISVAAASYGNGERALWHSHVQAQFFYTTRGAVRVLTPLGIWVLPPYRGIWIPAGIEHELHALGTLAGFSVYIEPDARPLGTPSPLQSLPCRAIPVESDLHALIVRVQGEVLRPVRSLQAQTLLTALVDQVRTAAPIPEGWLPLPGESRITAICSHLIRHPDNDATLEAWGDRIGISARTLARLFVSDTGLTFGQWRRQLCLIEAVARLALGDTVGDTAKALGFHSRSAFIAMFKRTLQRVPQDYFV